MMMQKDLANRERKGGDDEPTANNGQGIGVEKVESKVTKDQIHVNH